MLNLEKLLKVELVDSFTIVMFGELASLDQGGARVLIHPFISIFYYISLKLSMK